MERGKVMDFLQSMIKKAKENKKTIVLPETEDMRTLTAVAEVLKQDIANIILIGDKKQIEKDSSNLDISKAKIVDPNDFSKIDQYAKELYELRKHKGMTIEKAKETLKDKIYLGIMMVKMSEADGLVAGAIHSTGATLLPALQIIKTKSDVKRVSAFFVMVVPNCTYGANGTFAFGDCGLNENPNAEELSEIAISTANSFKVLTGEQPKVAMLSYSSYGSADSPLTKKVVEATKLAQAKAPTMEIDGELQLDAAIDLKTATKKAPGSKVAGNANVLIFPDLNAGNIGYKLTERLAKAKAYGPLLSGIAKPVNDLSRGCSADDIVGVIAITAVQAQL